MALLSRLQTGYRLMAGQWFDPLIDAVNSILTASGVISATSITTTDFTQNGILTRGVQTAAAAGSNSQANATPITKSLVIVATVSATTRAVRLPTAATGKTVQIQNGAATAVKVYPATGDKIAAAATNAVGTAIATRKGNIYSARDATTWEVLTGA